MPRGISHLLLHADFNKTSVAARYYSKVSPERFPATKEGRLAAQKQFQQDMHLDPAALLQVVSEIYQEQVQLLKTYAQIKLISEKKV